MPRPAARGSRRCGTWVVYQRARRCAARSEEEERGNAARALVKRVSTPCGNRLRDRRTVQWCRGRQRWSDISNANVRSASSAWPTHRAMTSESPDQAAECACGTCAQCTCAFRAGTLRENGGGKHTGVNSGRNAWSVTPVLRLVRYLVRVALSPEADCEVPIEEYA